LTISHLSLPTERSIPGEICCMRRVYIPSSSLNFCIPGWCYTASGRLAQASLFSPFQRRRTSSSSRMSLGSHVVFSDLRILSPLEGPHLLHANSTSLYIHLHMDAHPLDVSPRHPEATMTMQATRRPNHASCSGPEPLSLTREIAALTKTSSCRSATQRQSTFRSPRAQR
jgi:hypothetical protein